MNANDWAEFAAMKAKHAAKGARVAHAESRAVSRAAFGAAADAWRDALAAIANAWRITSAAIDVTRSARAAAFRADAWSAEFSHEEFVETIRATVRATEAARAETDTTRIFDV
jgi:hypothetical protein